MQRQSRGWLYPGAIFFGFLGLYASTLYEGLGGWINYGDSAKWQLLWAVNGTPHPTGYPLYLVLSGWAQQLFVILPELQRLDLLSAIFGAGALALSYQAWYRLFPRPWSVLLAVCASGTAFTYWSQSTEPEVYTLHAFLLAASHLLLVNFALDRRRRDLYLVCPVIALSFGNHLMMITVLPAAAYLVWQTDRTVFADLRLWVWGLLCAVLGASQYLYLLYLSHLPGAHLEFLGEYASFSRLLDYVTGGYFTEQFYLGSVADRLWATLWHLARDEFNWLLLVVALAAPFTLGRLGLEGQRKIGVSYFLLFFVCHALFTTYYDIPDIQVYYLPLILLLPAFSLLLVRGAKSRSAILALLLLSAGYNLYLNFPAFRQPKLNIASWLYALHGEVPAQGKFFSRGSESIFPYDGDMVIYHANALGHPEKPVQLVTDQDLVAQYLAGGDTVYMMGKDLQGLREAGLSLASAAMPYESLAQVMQTLQQSELGVILFSRRVDPQAAAYVRDKLGLPADPVDEALVAVYERGELVALETGGDRVALEMATEPCRDLKLLSQVDDVHRTEEAALAACDGRQISPNWRGINLIALDRGQLRTWTRNGTGASEWDLPPQLHQVRMESRPGE